MALQTSQAGNLKAADDSVVLSVNEMGTGAIQVVGTWVGTVSFYVSNTGDASDYVALNLTAPNSSVQVTSTTINGLWAGSIAGYAYLKVAMSAYTSGVASVLVSVVGTSGGSAAAGTSATEYTEGDTDSSITGTAVLWEDGSDTLRPVSAAKPLPVNIVAGAGSGGTAIADDAAFTVDLTNLTPVGGIYNAALDAVDDGDAGAFAMTAKRAQHTFLVDVNGDAVSVGGGTQYTQDAALTVATSVGPMAMGRASAAAPTGVSADNDAVMPWYLRSGAQATVVTAGGALVGGDATNGLDVDVTRVTGTVTIAGAVTNAGTFAVQATEADGANVTLGSKADDKSSATDTTAITAMSVLKQISASVQAPPSQAVTNAGTFAVQASTVGTITPGTAATSLGKAEDAAHSSGDVGVMALTVRQDTAAALGQTDGDYQPPITDASGRLHVNVGNTVTVGSHAVTNAGTFAVQVDGAALTALQLIDDPVSVLGTATYTEAASKGMLIGAVRRDADTTLVDTTNEIAPLQVNAGGQLKTAIIAALPAGTANIGDVDVLTVPADPFGANADASSATGSISAKLRFIAGTGIPITGTVTVGSHAVTVASGGIASGAVASGAVASGAFASGSIASGALASGSVADGAMVTLGAKADAKSTATDTTSITVMQVLKQISASVQAPPSQAVTNAGTFAVQAAGDVAHDGVDSGNPVKIGAKARSSEITAVASADRVDLIADLVGKLIVLPYANPENFVSGAITTAMTGTTSTSLVAAPASGLRNYLTTIIVSNAHASVGTDIIIQDGSGGTTLLTIPAGAVYGGAAITLPTPLRQPTTATAIYCANVTTGASTKVSAVGYKGA